MLTHSQTTIASDNLRLLYWLRYIAIAAQLGAISVAVSYLGMDLPLTYMIITIGVLLLFNLYTYLRLNNPAQISAREYFLQLCVDVILLTILLSLSGGATNPFAILYLLPMTLAALVLPVNLIWSMLAVTVVCYSSLLWWYVPMPHAHSHMTEFNLHVIGMWLGFVLSAVVLAYFLVRMQRIIQKQAQSLSKAKEEAIRNEQFIKLGMLATSTAHELGTPLNSMSLLLEDIEYEEATQMPGLLDKTEVLKQQIRRCREALNVLTSSAGTVNLQGGSQMALDQYINVLIKNWQASHQQLRFELDMLSDKPVPQILADKVIDHALTNIIDNAALVSPDNISIRTQWDQDYWYISIRDYGPGLTADAAGKIGKQRYSTKAHGMGLGLFLSHAVVERIGGMVELFNHEQGGLCTKVRLPLQYE